MTAELASRFARLALANIAREYPAKLDHVLAGPQDIASPRRLHPAFFGSFDWHSCVHAHWLLARVLAVHPSIPEADAVRAALETSFDEANLEAEVAYLRRPESAAFERSYGWAWLLKLAAELAVVRSPAAHRWSHALAPLAQAFAKRYLAWLADATYPVRHGVHTNTAFALAFAHDYAHACDDADLRRAVEAKARDWYANDVDAPAAWEPSGADFLSPVLIEAHLMQRLWSSEDLRPGSRAFCPDSSDANRRGSSRRPSSAIAPIRTSCISTGSIFRVRGAGAKSQTRFRSTTLGSRSPGWPRPSISMRDSRVWRAGNTSANIGSRRSRCWRSAEISTWPAKICAWIRRFR